MSSLGIVTNNFYRCSVVIDVYLIYSASSNNYLKILEFSMFRPIPLYIGLRYTRAKRRNHFVSFISLVSMLGIALGITVLITVLSVMNGFDYQIQHRIFDMAQQVTVSNFNGPLTNWHDLSQQVSKYPNVVYVAPFVSGQGMLAKYGQAEPVLVKGVDPAQEMKVSQLESKMVQGSFSDLKPGDSIL